MENSLRGTGRTDFGHGQPTPQPTMLKTAMSTPPNHAFYGQTNYWDVARPGDYSIPYRPRTDVDRTALPPIRLAIPELARPPHSATSPIASAPGSSTSEYVHSPNSNKRRRDSIGDEDRARCVPRYYNDPHRPVERRPSQPVSPAYAQRAIPEPWAHSTQATPPLPPGGLPAMRSPVSGRIEPFERHEARPALPSFPPPMGMERGPAPTARIPGPVRDEYAHEAPRAMYTPCPDPRYDGGLYRPVTYAFNPHPHPPRMQSLSLGAIPVPDRSPFSTNGYAAYGEYVRFGDGITMSGDNKQRKRRGNLPKETTDILRKWFLAHITHPYPSEEEKQSLMRETGLQMNQIANWFINARRRQLPHIISNARAEAEATSSGRGADGKGQTPPERGDYDENKTRRSPTTSDGGDSAFDDDLDARRRAQHFRRGGSY